jgi:hypothetical protein
MFLGFYRGTNPCSLHGRLMSLLHLGRRAFATDPRDIIYAVLNLGAVPPATMIPDYTLSVGQVFAQATRYYIVEGKGQALKLGLDLFL